MTKNYYQLNEANRCVMEEQNHNLVVEISFEESPVAIKQIHPDKASRTDYFNSAFFQQFWSILGREVHDCCKNDTNDVLISKKENGCYMKYF